MEICLDGISGQNSSGCWTAENLIKRAGTAEEQADAIMLCVTNDFMTGVTIDVDGGVLARI